MLIPESMHTCPGKQATEPRSLYKAAALLQWWEDLSTSRYSLKQTPSGLQTGEHERESKMSEEFCGSVSDGR